MSDQANLNSPACEQSRAHFSAYLDGALTGVEMRGLSEHLDECESCRGDFATWRTMQSALGALGTARPPADLALRLRVAVSQERTRTSRYLLAQLALRWENSFAPFLLRASAGLASAVLLIGTVGLLVGTFAAPEPLVASDEPIGMATSPRLLYSRIPVSLADVPAASADADPPDSSIPGSVVVRAFVASDGRVYDFHVISGSNDNRTHAALENRLLFSTFEPARVFGQPVSGSVVLSFADVSVQG